MSNSIMCISHSSSPLTYIDSRCFPLLFLSNYGSVEYAVIHYAAIYTISM